MSEQNRPPIGWPILAALLLVAIGVGALLGVWLGAGVAS